ncbi:MAG: tetratricopeptide repeat protein [Thermonemataceae bacterium]
MTTNYYLLHDSTEADEMKQTLQTLLEKGELTNIKLALPILQGGGLPTAFYHYVIGIYLLYEDEEVEVMCGHLLDTFLLEVGVQIRKLKQPLKALNEEKVYHMLADLATIPSLDLLWVAHQMIEVWGLGGKYCLKHALGSEEETIGKMIYRGKLSFQNFALEALPESIGKYGEEITILDICGNAFERLPDTIEQLHRLSGLDYENTPLNEKELIRLEEVFPDIMCDNYYKEASVYVKEEAWEKAAATFAKVTQLKGAFAEAWYHWGRALQQLQQHTRATEVWKKALRVYDERIEEHPNSANSYYGKALVYIAQRQVEAATEMLQQAITINKQYKRQIRYASEFAPFLSHKAFQQLALEEL